ncbi:MAG TPA: hypothetical protein VMD57_02405, partial [Candidatus Baltobacteraceae bacterium]|nr:hypothetical protein [Candidatus Baltobacteraceae bacterium]
DLDPTFLGVFHAVGIGSVAVCFWLCLKTRAVGTDWKAVLFMGLLWLAGAAFYFYEPIAGMTDPPMQWGYPRTVEGFFHALSRGQYDKAHPTDIIHHPEVFMMQLGMLVSGLASSYSWVYLFIALVPFYFLLKMQNRERAWIIGLASIYLCIGVLLTLIMNTSPDRQDADEGKVFFAASHAIVAIMAGYGMALLAAYMATHYASFRTVGLTLGTIILLPALVVLFDEAGNTFFGSVGSLTYTKALFLFLSMVGAFVLAAMAVQYFMKKSKESPDDDFLVWLFSGAALLLMGLSAYLAFSGEDRLGLNQVCEALPRIFASNQYSLPVWGALLILGTVVAFIASLFLYRNRAPVLITLCLFAAAPVYSGLTHWYKSEQRNHWFGYWFGHDMFTPPFGIYPQMTRNTILFGGTDPGRFCPTYMIFCESFIPHHCQPYLDQNFDRRDVYLITQNALADQTYLDYLRAQYNRSTQQDPPFFSRFFRYIAATIGFGTPGSVVTDLNNIDAGKGDTGNRVIEGIASLLDATLDKPLTKLGKEIEDRRRAQGVYPPNEIYIPTPADSEACFEEYSREAQLQADSGGRVSISGQIPVMMINGLLCKVIFDNNPTNDFYVEESFPLDWMYPYETPAGIIMKINRNPLPELPDDVFKKDHEFWSKYSDRLIGNWITYDTTVQQIADFAQKVYLGNNYTGFTGDRKFIRDDDAQKAFSKLRSSIAGMYAWRCSQQCPPEYRQKTQAGEDALIRETDFAFKQSFAFCPYSPEAVFRYVNFLLSLGRLDDAMIVAQTCSKLDPYNSQVSDLITQLEKFKKESADRTQTMSQLQQMETEASQNPSNITNLLTLGSIYLQMQQTNRAVELFDEALTNANISYTDVASIAQIYAHMGYLNKVEIALEKLVAISPDKPEPHYDLAALKAILGQTSAALQDLQTSLELSAQRLKTNPAARDLLAEARKDPRFDSLRALPGFQKIVPSN